MLGFKFTRNNNSQFQEPAARCSTTTTEKQNQKKKEEQSRKAAVELHEFLCLKHLPRKPASSESIAVQKQWKAAEESMLKAAAARRQRKAS